MTLNGIIKFLKDGGYISVCINKKVTLFTLHNSSGLYISPIFEEDVNAIRSIHKLEYVKNSVDEKGNHFYIFQLA